MSDFFFLTSELNSFRLHTELLSISDMVTAEMMNYMKTKADGCDKYNTEQLINLVWVEGNGERTADGIS